MKYLTLVRHGKSHSHADEQTDFERPLTEVGISDSSLIGSYIKKKLPVVDLIISSPAFRAAATSQIISDSLNYERTNILYYDKLYLCSVSDYFDILTDQESGNFHILVVSHNPGTTGLTNILTGRDIFSIPTCGFSHIGLGINNWEELEPGLGILLEYLTPAILRNV